MTTTHYPKRLIEVDLPIKRISESARNQSRSGRLASLHAWWARKPSGVCRAVLCAALWPDPADLLCPLAFRDKARKLMLEWTTHERQALLSAESRPRFEAARQNPKRFDNMEELRSALLDFIADFSNWDNSTKKEYLETGRALTQSAHEALGGEPDTRPLVVDPFAGGGSIPLEALRVGADVFASDLNPVAVLLNKVVLEYIPRYGQRLADEVRKWGKWIKEQAEKELAEFYPKDPSGATPIAYVWARTIRCEGPGCGALVPMKSSMWLCEKRKRKFALSFRARAATKSLKISVVENPNIIERGTVARGSVTCPICGFTTPIKRVRKQLQERGGGAFDSMLLAVILQNGSNKYRYYREPMDSDFQALHKAELTLKSILGKKIGDMSIIPMEPTPNSDSHRSVVSPGLYGINKWMQFFTSRQVVALSTLCESVLECAKEIGNDCTNDLRLATQTVLALVFDKVAQNNSSACRWKARGESFVDMFGHHAFTFGWDFAESNPIGKSSGSFWSVVTSMSRTVSEIAKGNFELGTVLKSSALNLPIPDNCAHVLFTDPPYYDAVAYGDLSDFFYVWLKRVLYKLHQEIMETELIPKNEEILVKHPNNVQEHIAFSDKMRRAMEEGKRILSPNGLGVVVFAHKSTAGWEAQLEAMYLAGWKITASWPIHTELESRLSASGTASLASSIHLICRPKKPGFTEFEDVGDWRDVLTELPKRIHDWMPRLATEGIVGADAIFACLGPALEIFSRYFRVEKASGEQVTLKEYLEHVWAAVAKEALNMIFEGADATGFEEDARLTAMWLWTLSTGDNGNGRRKLTEDDEEIDEEEDSGKPKKIIGGYALEYDAARKIAQGLGAHLEKLSSVVEVKGETARLLPVSERTRYLFGKDETEAPTTKLKRKEPQLKLGFMQEIEDIETKEGWGAKSSPKAGSTVLDRIHQSMILFAAGRSEALKRFLVEEGAGNDQRFWRLAQALSALYPKSSDEKRWVDGVLARKKSLGF